MLVLVMFAAQPAWCEQVQLIHMAIPSNLPAMQSPIPLAVGMRVLVSMASLRCLEEGEWNLRLYPLGSAQSYESRIVGRRELDGCVREFEAVLPQDIPMGVAEAVLTGGNGRAIEPFVLRIVPVQFGLVHDAGRARAQRVEGGRPVALGLTTPARVGTRVKVLGTGLGRARAEEVMLRVGSVRVKPLVVRPVVDEPGLEEVEFTVPDLEWTGCYVPLAAEVRGVERNVASIPVAEGAGPCRHRFGLTAQQMQLLDDGARIPLITFSVIRDYELTLVASGMAGADWVAHYAGVDDPGPRAGCRVSTTPGLGEAAYWWQGEPGDRLKLGELALTWPDGRKENPRHEPLGPAAFSFYGIGSSERTPDPGGVWQLRASGGDVEIDWRVRVAAEPRAEGLNVTSMVRSGGVQEVRWNGGDFEEGEWMQLRMYREGGRDELVCMAPAQDGRMDVAVDEFLKLPAEEGRRVWVQMGAVQEGPRVFPLGMRDGVDGVGVFGGSGRTWYAVEE